VLVVLVSKERTINYPLTTGVGKPGTANGYLPQNTRLQIYGDKPEVTKLFGGRYRMEVRCKAAKDTEAWYNDNKDQIFADFGTLYSAQMSVDGIDPRVGEAYANMVLTSNQASYTPTGEYVISFVYETLTDTFVQEADDKVDYEMANLRRVTRSVVANRGTSYNKVVGTSTISHTEHGQGTITLTLASVEEDRKVPNSAGYTRLVEVWVESGILNVSKQTIDDGVIQVETTFLVTEGATVGSIVSRRTQNYEGLKTITVTTRTAADGTDLVGDGGADKLIDTSYDLINWTRPGVAGIKELDLSIGSATSVQLHQEAPTQMKIRARIDVYYSTDPTISDADFDTITGGTGVALWNPEVWATLEGDINGNVSAGLNDISRTLRGFRVIDSTDSAYSDSGDTRIKPTGSCKHGYEAVGSGVQQSGKWFNQFSTYNNFSPDGLVLATASIVGGPDKPEGKIWMIDVDPSLDFTAMDGTKYYKKVYVWAYIPDFENGEDIWDDAP